MAPRPSWKGHLRLSLVSCPVALYPSASSSEKISFHMLNGNTHNRLKQQYIDAETGDLVERDARVKGYEIAKGDYVIVTDDELADVKLESSHTIDIEKFVPKAQIDALYFDNNYYIAPDDKVGEEAFAVIREAMQQRKMVGIARVVLFGKERMIMLEPRSKGLVGTTLRYAYEVRGESSYFEEIPKVEITKELLDLASHIIDTKTGKFDPSEFQDRYQDAVVDLIRAKQAGRPAPVERGAERPTNVVNLMDALRRSLGQSGGSGKKDDAPAAGAGGRRVGGKATTGKATATRSADSSPKRAGSKKTTSKTAAKAVTASPKRTSRKAG